MFVYNNYYLTNKMLTPEAPCPACVAGIPKKTYMEIPLTERFENMQKGIISEMGHHVDEWSYSGNSAAGRCIHCKAHVNLIAMALTESLPQSVTQAGSSIVNMDMIRVSYDEPIEDDFICIFMANTQKFHYDIITNPNGVKCPRTSFLCPKTQAIL